MSETLTAPVVDPEEFSPEDMEAIREAELRINEQLDTYVSSADIEPEVAHSIVENLERQAVADPKTFLAAREQLSAFTDEEDPTDEQIEKEEVLKDVIDGPLHARTVTKYGVFAPPTPEVRARVESAVAAVRDAESAEGKQARKTSTAVSLGANMHAINNARKGMQDAMERGDEGVVKLYRETIGNLSRSMDIQARGTGNTQRVVDAVDEKIAEVRHENPGMRDDDPRLAGLYRRRDLAQADVDKVKEVIGNLPSVSARERLRNLLDEHPEGMDVIHKLESTHIGFTSGESVTECYEKKRDKLDAASAKVAELSRTLDAGDGRIALAQIAEFKARQEFNTVDAHHAKDRESADFLTNLANENARDKRVREQQEAAMGTMEDLEDETFEGLVEWQHKGKAIAEHGAFVGMKKVEAYISALDEKIALADVSNRDLPHLRALRDEAFDSYLQLQYHKEIVRTEMYANSGDFEGRHGLAHTPDKGILVERANGAFVIYPDGTYSSVYEEEGEQRLTPRVNAQGERVTTPVLEQIPDPRALVDPTTLRAWEHMTLDNLKTVDSAIYGAWLSDPTNVAARARLEVVAGMLRERSAFEDNTLTHMEATYTERYMAVGRDGNPDQLMPDGSVAGHMTLHGIEGGWLLHPNGAADLYTPGATEPVSRYNPDGTILGAIGPETPEPPETPESPDTPDDEVVSPAAPVPTPTPVPPSAPIAPGRPGAVGGVSRPASMRVTPGIVTGEAPAPPTPPTPEDEPEAPTREKHKAAALTPEDRATIKKASEEGTATSAIYTSYDSIDEGLVRKVGKGKDLNRAVAEQRVQENNHWSAEDIARYNVAPESVIFTRQTGGTIRMQYRYEPRSGMASNSALVVDTELSAQVANDLATRILQKPEVVRDVVRAYYENAFGRGTWADFGRPPYEQISNAKLTIAMEDPANPGVYIAQNYPTSS